MKEYSAFKAKSKGESHLLQIKHIRIKNFRSIVDLNIDVDKMNLFVGLNDAGKSNILKALNLFFNGETEPGYTYNFVTDYSQYAPVRRKKAKEIIVSIVFSIPQNYSDHDDVVWTKTWREGGLYKDSSSEWVFSSYSRVPTLLRRIRFKYVPAIKSDNYFKLLLADLYKSIAKEVNTDLLDKSVEYSLALNAFTKGIGQRVQETVGISSNLVMPANQEDIFKELTFLTKDKSDKSIDLPYRGDGIKAIHIPAILKFIAENDNHLMSNATVPITTIWAYEEPENGIEMRKCFDLAKELKGFSLDVQEFITTHSPAFYQMGNLDDVKVFYVYKSKNDFYSMISENGDFCDLNDEIGIMPIIAPYIEQKQKELDHYKELLSNITLSDVDTIFVEGITDKAYYEKAIQLFSPFLQKRLNEGTLRIVTREDRGCGTSLLVEWAVAWIHMNYSSKAVFLLDADEAGKSARQEIIKKCDEYNKRSYNFKVLLLQPTDSMKEVCSILNNCFSITVEHLLSYDFWRQIIKCEWVKRRTTGERFNTFKNFWSDEKTIKETADELITDEDFKDTILSYSPSNENKENILKAAMTELENGNTIVMDGFRNTISSLEKEFGKI